MRRSDRPRTSSLAALAIVLASTVSCSPDKSPALAPSKPDQFTLYEGLPHDFYEPEKLAEEKKKPTIEKGGFPFYRDPLPLKAEDADELGPLLADPKSFRPFKEEKKCGGFHPDYAVIVSSAGKDFTYLLCFGCSEAKVYGPDGSETRYDIVTGRLKEILKPYQKNRPMPIAGP